MGEASDREHEAWEQRYKHSKAARLWSAVANENPARREVSEVLARWMYAYADADAVAEQEFRSMAAGLGDEEPKK